MTAARFGGSRNARASGAVEPETAERKVAISEHLQQLENQNTLLRDEMEIKILKFEDDLKEIQQKYFENAVTDSDTSTVIANFSNISLPNAELILFNTTIC